MTTKVLCSTSVHPANIYLFKVNYGKPRRRYEICSELAKRHRNDINEVIVV